MNKPDVVEVVKEMNSLLENYPILNVITNVITRRIENLNKNSNGSSDEITQEKIDKIFSLYKHIEQLWNDNSDTLNKLYPRKSFLESCKVSDFDELQQIIKKITFGKNYENILKYNNIYECLQNITNLLVNAIKNAKELKDVTKKEIIINKEIKKINDRISKYNLVVSEIETKLLSTVPTKEKLENAEEFELKKLYWLK
jgi:hypothetical protein